jgi:transposase
VSSPQFAVEFISHDRAGGYAEGARRGALDAIQIADRFYLLRNLTEAMQYAVKRHQDTIRAIDLEPRISAGLCRTIRRSRSWSRIKYASPSRSTRPAGERMNASRR